MIFRMFFDRTFVKFAAVGIVNTFVGSVIMFVLYNAVHLSYWLSSACNYCITSAVSFFLNKYITFNIRNWSASMVSMFGLTIAFSYLTSYGISKLVMNYFLRHSPRNIRDNTALFTGMCLFTCLNYLGQRLIVFKRNRDEK